MHKLPINFRFGMLIFILVFTGLACNLIVSPGSNASAPQDTARNETVTPLPPTPTLGPTVTPTRTLTPTLVDPVCVPLDSPDQLAAGDFEDYPEAVLTFLNQGGTPEQLEDTLYAAGVASQPVGAASADLTGDQKIDILVSIFNPASQRIAPPGSLLIYTCQDGAYALSLEQASMDNWGAPLIRFVEDMNADGRAEVVVSSAMCGAHTCFERVQLLMWDGAGFNDRLQGSTAELPYPEVDITDEDGDGVFALEVSATGFGSVGAGPPRGETWIWTYNAENGLWEKTDEILAESNFRIHILHDADRAARQGDYDQALLLYGRVISDSTLEDWVDPESERANLSAYALFKTGVIHYLRGDEELGAAAFDQLRGEFPPQTEGHAYAELANVFESAYASGDISASCQAVQGSAQDNAAQVLTPLGSESFGYGNPQVVPEDICPWD